jgi:hypothetical protein
MYDYFLGGHHNFEVDRRAADQAIAIYPDFPLLMRVGRAFLRRAVRFLTAQGVTQFLDIGSGIPTVGNVHQLVHEADTTAHVVYVDADPVAVAHSRAILQDDPRVTIIQADAREPEQILNHPETRRLLDLNRPVAVLLVFVLHFIPDEHAYRVVRVLRDAVAPGSYIAISHGTYEGMPAESLERLVRLYNQTPTPVRVRSRAEFEPFFDGLELVEPGLVYVPLWRPEASDDLFLDQPERSLSFAGIGRKV